MEKASGSITVSEDKYSHERRIYIGKNLEWFNVEYYRVIDDGECLIITKSRSGEDVGSHKIKKGQTFWVVSDMPIGKFHFSDESTEDEIIIYYK